MVTATATPGTRPELRVVPGELPVLPDRLVYGEESVRVGRVQKAILSHLLGDPEHQVDRDALMLAVWGSADADVLRTLRVTLFQVNAKLEALGCPLWLSVRRGKVLLVSGAG